MSKEERRAEIQKAAVEAFKEKGFNNTTMEEIISRTTMSKGGVYHYYKGTDYILKDIMIRGIKYRVDVNNKGVGISEGERREKIYIGLEKYLDLYVNRLVDDNYFMPVYVIFLKEAQRNPRLAELFQELKKESIEMNKHIVLVFEDGTQLEGKEHLTDFAINFTNAIILGSEILGARENFIKNKEVLKEMMRVYFLSLKNRR